MFILQVSAHLLQNRQNCHLSNEHLNLPLQKNILKFLRWMNHCVIWIPHLQERHHLNTMKDIRFKTLPNINPVNWENAIVVTSTVRTRLHNAAAITGEETRCFQRQIYIYIREQGEYTDSGSLFPMQVNGGFSAIHIFFPKK